MVRFLAFFASASLALAAGAASGAEAAAQKEAAKAHPAKVQAIATPVCVACHSAAGNSAAPANPEIAGPFAESRH